MRYLEFHECLKKDSIMYSYLASKFRRRNKKIPAGEIVLVSKKYVAIVEKGVFVKESVEQRKFFTRSYFQETIVVPTTQTIRLKALEESVISFIEADIVFEKLEEEKLLSNLFLQVAEKLEADLERQEMLAVEFPENRIIETLYFISISYSSKNLNLELPHWLRIKILAKFANCSVSTASSIVHDLHKEGIIDIKASPWQLNKKALKFKPA
ncbi:Crp/Fnr family transcriptional regulator [Listeria sp. FSL L7-1485]|uniref:Crp/Fnr family transcriptional regulator n=1 Tax=Listeria immobilis TaxID=2713502 RepID=A0A7X0X7V8_9LIST|nr:Crp/Fnr family transcriptional regulator [Listeria immobilis]MBC1489127.1 Crp/Fnr family transcriptional regulator [Listeria immobilis]MBC1536056.1 Crp/Fnr family transcriptional regulator [Listeria immobilis]